MNLHEVFQTGQTSWIIILFLYVKSATSAPDPYVMAACNEWYTPQELFAANCTTDYYLGDKRFYKVPNFLPISIQLIDFRPRGSHIYSGLLIEKNVFTPYPNLRRILMQRMYQIYRITTNMKDLIPSLQNDLQLLFTGLRSLEYIEMNECYLDDTLVVHLPRQLKAVNFDNNRYQKLNVHWATELEEISARNNSLINVPKLSVPSPPLKILRLNDNPLNEMTIVDIAQLCELTLLELSFSPSSHYASQAGYCQCTMLKLWAVEAEIKGVDDVKCYDQGNKPNCDEHILEEARTIKHKCPLLKKGALSSSIYSVMKWIFLLIILALVLAGVILYVIRHFHLKEYMANYHLSLHHAALPSASSEDDEEDASELSEENAGEESV